MALNIEEITAKVAVDVGGDAVQIKRAVKKLFREIQTKVDAGEKVVVPGFGAFVLKTRPAGEKVSAKTGETRTVEASSNVSFRASKQKTPEEREAARAKKAAK